MTDYCLFRMYGPMASWGGIAVGEERGSEQHPTKSAVLGLIGASCGVRRDNETLLMALATAYGVAMMINAPGNPVTDFHTVQTAPRKHTKKRHMQTRKDALSLPSHELETLLSRRAYLYDSFVTVCLSIISEDAPFTLEDLCKALASPVFVPYLGRKSCPPSLPFEARIVKAETVYDAFMKADFVADMFLQRLKAPSRVRMVWDGKMDAGVETVSRHLRRDDAVNRRRWEFALRDEYTAVVNAPRGGQ